MTAPLYQGAALAQQPEARYRAALRIEHLAADCLVRLRDAERDLRARGLAIRPAFAPARPGRCGVPRRSGAARRGRCRPRCSVTGLERALIERERAGQEAVDRLRELATPETENEVYDLTLVLRDTITLTACLRRLVAGRTAAEIHAAFGAPGDFGYGTPIGAALNDIYRGAR